MKGAKIRGKEHVFISRVGWFSTVVCVDKAEKRDVTFQQRDGAACPITKRKTIGHLTLQKHSSYVRLWWFGLFHLCCWWPCWYWLLTWWQNAQQVGADVVILQTSWDETELHDSNKYPLSRQIYYGWPFSKCFFSNVDLRTHDCFIGVAP